MSRAKEEALKAYPPRSIAANYDTINRRDAFEYGYLKAEKDLELTWQDIEKITDIWYDLHEDEAIYSKTRCDTPEFYKEVLKRFKEREDK